MKNLWRKLVNLGLHPIVAGVRDSVLKDPETWSVDRVTYPSFTVVRHASGGFGVILWDKHDASIIDNQGHIVGETNAYEQFFLASAFRSFVTYDERSFATN